MSPVRIICMGKLRLECNGCGSHDAFMVFVPQYKGYRGVCPQCSSNWPES